MSGAKVAYTPIGVVSSPRTEMSKGDWGAVESEIRLDPAYTPGLAGLAGFSHLVVVFHLDQIGPFDPASQLMRKPRGTERAEPVGVFAQRTKYRPNPVGVTAVELVAVRDNVLVVRGLDALDGTPVLDVKPYMPMFDRIEDARLPEWVGRVMEGYF